MVTLRGDSGWVLSAMKKHSDLDIINKLSPIR